MTIEKARKIIKDYSNLYQESRKCKYYAYGVDEFELILNKLEVMGLEWGDPLVIPNDFELTKGYYLTNSATHYKKQDSEWYIQWDNGNVGSFQFVSTNDHYNLVKDEWDAFRAELLSYNPLDYDPLNCHIIYDIENGKKVMANYADICKRTKAAMQKKIDAERIRKMREELAKLEKEAEHETD